MNIPEKLRALRGFRSCGENQYQACCPGHSDNKASLSISTGNDGKLLLHCHAGCSLEQILEPLGLKERDLFADNGNGHKERRIDETYDYQDAAGIPSYQVVRFDPKDFRQRKPDGNGGWIWSAKGLKRLPYNLPELAAAEYVWIFEGEKDVESARKIGLTGTCIAGGANSPDWPTVAQYFRPDQHITIVPDNDPPGEIYGTNAATALFGKVASLKILHLEGLPEKGDVSDWLVGRDPQAAAEELCRLADAAPEWKPEKAEELSANSFQLYDAADIESWPNEPLIWLAEGIIPKGGIGFMSAPPKDRKSLLTADLALHLAQPGDTRPWLGKFKITPTKVLYIAREDPRRRISERVREICKSYGMSLPSPGQLQFLIRDRIHLTEILHRDWLAQTIQANGFELLVLDVLNRMIPDLDELSAKDMAQMVSILEDLNRDLGVTILCLDHTRKPQGKNLGRDTQEPNPFDLKGSIAKYGCADFMICLARTPQDSRMQVYCENKDTDERPHFFVDVSPKGSTDPKFQFAGDVEKLAADRKAIGDANREKVFQATPIGQWVKREEIQLASGLKESTVNDHLKALHAAGRLERTGSNRSRRYRRPPETNNHLFREQT